MRTLLLGFLFVIAAAACDETHHSNVYDLGASMFTHIGEPCQPDTAQGSECGYPPQFYCTSQGICASACKVDMDCADGSKCVGAGDMIAGECRQPEPTPDGG